jgi:hypothetical protein
LIKQRIPCHDQLSSGFPIHDFSRAFGGAAALRPSSQPISMLTAAGDVIIV